MASPGRRGYAGRGGGVAGGFLPARRRVRLNCNGGGAAYVRGPHLRMDECARLCWFVWSFAGAMSPPRGLIENTR
jgi:hypothetical protein